MAIQELYLNLPGSPDHDTALAFAQDYTLGETGDTDGITFTRSGVATRWKLVPDRYIQPKGIAGAYASTPNNTKINAVTQGHRIRAKIAAVDYTPGSVQTICGQYGAAGNRKMKLSIMTDGKLRLTFSLDGTAEVTATSTVATGFTDGAERHVEVLFAIDSAGAWTVDFKTSSDGGITWSALGSQVTGGGGGGGTTVINGAYLGTPAGLQAFENWLGKAIKIALTYVGWNIPPSPTNPNPTEAQEWTLLSGANTPTSWYGWLNAVAGRQLVVTVAIGVKKGSTTPLVQMKNGDYDTYYRTFARNMFSRGGTTDAARVATSAKVLLRLGWEMDGGWYPWKAGPGTGANGEDSFAAAYRRIVDVMDDEVPNNKWRFFICPTANRVFTNTWLNKIWPGGTQAAPNDDKRPNNNDTNLPYVDHIGIDVYDTTNISGGYQSTMTQAERLATPIQNAVKADLEARLAVYVNYAAAKNKKIAFNEWGVYGPGSGGLAQAHPTTLRGGWDNPQYIARKYAWMNIASNRVLYHQYFNSEDETQSHDILPTTRHPDASDKYKELFSQTGTVTDADLFASNAPLEIGSSQSGMAELFNGKIFLVELFDNELNRVAAVFDADASAPSNLTHVSASGETWTLNGELRIIGAEVETVAANSPRDDYNPDTLTLSGRYHERGSVNAVRNSGLPGQNLAGAVAGSPGTLPTNWLNAGTLSGLTRDVTGVGVEAGVPYVQFRLSGTPSASSNSGVYMETAAAAAVGQTWTGSLTYKIIGPITGISNVFIELQERQGATLLEQSSVSEVPTANALRRHFTHTRMLTNALTDQARIGFFNAYTSGVPVDITFRIYAPQLEQGASRTSWIPTSTVAVARGDEDAEFTDISAFYQQSGYSVLVEIATTEAFDPGKDSSAVAFTDNSSNEVARLRLVAGTKLPNLRVVDGGVEQASVDGGVAATGNQVLRISGGWKANEALCSAQGAAAGSDTTVTLPTPTRLHIGSLLGSDHFLGGYIRRVFGFKKAFAAATHQSLSLVGPTFKAGVVVDPPPTPGGELPEIYGELVSERDMLDGLIHEALVDNRAQDAKVLQDRMNSILPLLIRIEGMTAEEEL